MGRLSRKPRTGPPGPSPGSGFPWVDGDVLFAADLNAAFLPTSGGTLTGDSARSAGYFTLALDPTSPMHAATKPYVDGGGGGGGGGPWLPTSGGVLNGPGNLAVGGTLGVTGAATLSGAATALNDFAVKGRDGLDNVILVNGLARNTVPSAGHAQIADFWLPTWSGGTGTVFNQQVATQIAGAPNANIWSLIGSISYNGTGGTGQHVAVTGQSVRRSVSAQPTTTVTATLGVPSPTVSVADVAAFQKGGVNQDRIKIGSNWYTQIAVTGLSGPGTLTVSTNVTVADGTAGNTVIGQNNPGFWGGLSQVIDTTGASSDLSGPLIGHEFNLFANGLDVAQKRHGLILVLGQNNTSGAAVEAVRGIGIAGPAAANGWFQDVIQIGAAFSHSALNLSLPGAVQLPGANAIWLGTGHSIAFDPNGKREHCHSRAARLRQEAILAWAARLALPASLTATGGFNGNTVFGIGSGGVGVGRTVNNTATVARLNVTGSTHVWTPSTVIDATSQAIISPGQSVTGTMGATDGSVWNFGLAGNSIDNSAAPDPFMPFKVATNFGGTKGSIGAFSINQTQTSDTLDPDGLTRFYNTLQITQNLAHRVGNQSNSVGVGIYINQAASAVGWANVEGIEVGIQRVAGTTINAYNILGMIATNTSGNHAVDYESYLHMFAASGSTSLNTGILLGTPGGQWPIDPTNGWIIDTYQQKNNNPGLTQRMAQASGGAVLDFSQVNFSDSVMKSPGVRIKGIAEIDIGPASIAASATGAQIDVVGYKGALGAVIANGATYQVNDQLYDGCGGIISVDTISGPGGVLTAHYLPGKEPYWYGTGAPATVATTGGSGNGAATFNVTWTALTTLSLQPSGGALRLPGIPASTSYANDAAAATGGVPVGQLYRNGSVLQVRVA